MGTRDPRVDAYIEKSAEFARPILTHIRETVHAACPECEETLKWGMPTFMYHGILCGMAAFKAHATLGFWKGSLIVEGAADEDAMGQFGRITSVKDLPGKRQFTGYIRKAMELNRDGIKVQRATPKKRGTMIVKVPADLAAALKSNRKALETFDAFPPSQRKEYVEWITEAKREATREKRIEETIELLKAGKTRHWKYQRA